MRFIFSQTSFAIAAAIGALVVAAPAGAAGAAQRFVVAQAAEQAPAKVSGTAEGVIKGIDADDHKLLINHGEVKGTLAMGGMTMPFKAASGIDVGAFKVGEKVKFTLTRDEKGLFLIEKIERAD